MAKFQDTKRKLERLFNLAVKNESLLSNRQLSRAFLLQNHLNVPTFEIFNSDWQTIKIGANEPNIFRTPTSHSDNSNEFRIDNTQPQLAQEIFYDYEIPAVDIAEVFLPFVDFLVECKTIPETNVFGLSSWQRVGMPTKQIITVSGTEIFHDIASSDHRLYTQEDIDDGLVNANALKKVFFATYGSSSGYITEVRILYDSVANTGDCLAFPDYKEYIIYYNLIDKHQITSISTTTVTGIASVYQHTFTEPTGGGCDETITTLVDRASATKNFTDGDVFLVQIKIENADFPFAEVTRDRPTSDPIDNGLYWLYFGTDKYPPRVGFQTVSGDERLLDVPGTNLGSIVVTPSAEPNYESLYLQANKTIGILKISKETDIMENWRLKISGSFIITALPTQTESINVISTSEKINTYTFPYITRTDTDISQFETRYRIPDQDIQWRIRAILRNPFYERSLPRLTDE